MTFRDSYIDDYRKSAIYLLFDIWRFTSLFTYFRARPTFFSCLKATIAKREKQGAMASLQERERRSELFDISFRFTT